MKTAFFVKFLIWCITAIFVFEIVCEALSYADTLFNIGGIIIGAVYVFLTYKTQFFTLIKIKK